MSILLGLWIGYAIVMLPIFMFVVGALLVPMDSNLPKLSKKGNLAFGVFILSLVPGMVFWTVVGVLAFIILKVADSIPGWFFKEV